MKITSKYEVDANIWFLNNPGSNDESAKFFEGIISGVEAWDKWTGFRYDIYHINTEGRKVFYNVAEKDIYSSKEEIMLKAFVPNSELIEEDVPEGTVPEVVVN